MEAPRSMVDVLPDVRKSASTRGHLLRASVAMGGARASSVDLGAGRFRFGASVDCDYLVAGSQAPILCAVVVQPGGRFEIEAGADLELNGRPLAAGQVSPVVRRASIKHADLTIVIEPVAGRGRLVATMAGLACVTAIAVTLAGLVQLNPALSSAPAPMAALPVDRPAPAPAEMTDRAHVDGIRRVAARLGHAVKVETGPDGKVIVSGYVPESQHGIVKEAVESVGPRGKVVLRLSKDEVEPVAPPAPAAMKVASVFLGSQPSVIISSGRRLSPGDALGDGWVVARITRQYIELKNGPHSRQVSF